MKTPRHLPALLASCTVLTGVAGRADDAALRPAAFQTGIHQQALGAETAELARSITALIEELQRNNFPVQTLGGLSELAEQLAKVGGGEMTSIATRLRRLGENGHADSRGAATEAYLAQQSIESRLNALASQIAISQLREEAARRVEALINRQLAAQREARALAAARPHFDRSRLLLSDQNGISEDLQTFFQTGESLLARLREANERGGTNRPAAPEPSFAQRVNAPKLSALSADAAKQIRDRRFLDAVPHQEELIAELRKLLLGILSSQPKEQRLASALQQVSALRQEEQARAANQANQQQARQAAADQAATLADQVAAVSPEAAEALKKAAQDLAQAQPPTPPPPPTPPTPPAPAPAANPPAPQTRGQEVAATPPPATPPGETPPGSPAAQPPPPPTPPGSAPATPPPPEGALASTPPPPPPPPAAATPPPSSNDAASAKKDENAPSSQHASTPPPPPPPPPPPAASPAAAQLAAAEEALANALAQAMAEAAKARAPLPASASEPGQPKEPGNENNANQLAEKSQLGTGSSMPDPNQKPDENKMMLGDGGGQFDGEVPPEDSELAEGHRKVPEKAGRGTTHQLLAGGGPEDAGAAQALGALRREEREAFQALQNERYPAEFSAWVQQYWRNLTREQ